MDTVLILQIITILISISTLVINTILTVKESKKNHYLKVTTEQRRRVFIQNRENQAAIIALCIPECIDEKRTNNSPFKYELANKYAKLLYFYKQIYDDENEIIVCANALLKKAYKYYDNCSELTRTSLLDELSKFYRLTSVYDAADWAFLKAQSSGNEINSNDFDKIIAQKRVDFDNSNATDIFKD